MSHLINFTVKENVLLPLFVWRPYFQKQKINNTTQHNTTQHNTTQHNTTQHKLSTKVARLTNTDQSVFRNEAFCMF